MRSLFGLLLLIGVITAFKVGYPSREERKQLAGPPSEFPSMAIPSPETAALRADSTLRPFTLTASRNGQEWSWSGSYPVDAQSRWSIAISSPFAQDISIWLAPPPDSEYYLLVDSMFEGPDSIAKKSTGPLGIDGNTVPVTTYTFYNPPRGTWLITLNSTTPINQKPGLPHGYLILDNESDYKLLSYLNSYELEEGQELGLVVRMYRETPETLSADRLAPVPEALQDVITTAEMEVILPDGNEIDVPMYDDGQHYDLGANDGIYGASIEATTPGQYIFNSIVSGTTDEGAFQRTCQHLIQVTSPEMTLTGLAYSTFSKSTNVLSFYLDVDLAQSLLDDPDAQATVMAYAEVWGSNENGLEYLPVAWVEAVVDPEQHPDLGLVLRLDLNAQWIQLAGAYPPFQLRNAYVQDINTNGILSVRKEIFVQPDDSVVSFATSLAKLYVTNPNLAQTITITEEMKMGPRPAKFRLAAANETAEGGAVMLVHGYCSGDVWPSADFPGSVKFQDYSKSRSQDEFALMIKAFAESLKLPSFSIVGHSQGGLAGLHLKSFYWSGLDTATGGRIIQSVGSPYYGCSLAGTLADLGGVFGVGCSSNPDLAPEGAALWSKSIPTDFQKLVYYYLTKYDNSFYFNKACVTGSSLVMFTPNDGTCEETYAKLSGGNFQGMTLNQCHTSGMNYPQQTFDSSRNKNMNSLAAR